MPELADSTVLVTGGAGFIGSHVVEQLLAQPVRRVIVLDNFVRGNAGNLEAVANDARLQMVEGSITDGNLLARLMVGCDYVFHLAALWLYECVHEPRRALDVNIGGTYNVVEAAHEAGVRKVVYSSSASVYGDARAIPMSEEHPFDNRTMYGATKIAGEQFFRAFNEQHGLDWTGLRYMNVYGPRMDYLGSYVSVIMKVLDKLDEGEPPVIFGDGTQAYDFVHVHDVARANLLALTSDVTDEVFNVGTGVQTSIRELVDVLRSLSGSDIEPDFRPQEETFVTNRVGSTERAERRLGFHAEVPLEEGLRTVVDWRRQDQGERARA
ncbi:MAG: NAD-dependent epimerase/dehydratase family protein [Gaiellaceae bacterium]